MDEQEGLLQVSSIGKGIIGGGIEMVKSIGPLEGKTQIKWYGVKYFNKKIKGTEKEEKHG